MGQSARRSSAGRGDLPAATTFLRFRLPRCGYILVLDRRSGPIRCWLPDRAPRFAVDGYALAEPPGSASMDQARERRRRDATARRLYGVDRPGRHAAQPRAHGAAPSASDSHRGKGWEQVTACAIDALVRRPTPALRWPRSSGDGRGQPSSRDSAPSRAVESAHPSPLSASQGFFGSRPFSRVNRLLVEQGARAGRLVAPRLRPANRPARKS